MVSETPILPPSWGYRLFRHAATHLPLLPFPNNHPLQPPMPPWLKGCGPAQDRVWEESRTFSAYCSKPGMRWQLSLPILICLLKSPVLAAGLCRQKVWDSLSLSPRQRHGCRDALPWEGAMSPHVGKQKAAAQVENNTGLCRKEQVSAVRVPPGDI